MDIVKGTATVPAQPAYVVAVALDPETPAPKKTKDMYELNLRAYGELILSMDTETNSRKVAWAIVHASKTVALPNGDSALETRNYRRSMLQ